MARLVLRLTAALTLSCLFGYPAGAQERDRAALLSTLRPAIQNDLPDLGPLEALPYYELELRLSDDLRSYRLLETLVFTNTTAAPLADLALRLYANKPERPRLIQLSVGSCRPDPCGVTQPDPSVIRVVPNNALAVGESLRVVLQLAGTLRQIESNDTSLTAEGLQSLSTLLSGESRSDYGMLGFGDGIASLANFYAVPARRKGHAWVLSERSRQGDFGAEGVSFVHAEISAPRDVVIASSGVSAERLVHGEAERRTLAVSAALVRDFALVASRDFRERSRRVGDINVRSFFLNADADGGERVLDTAAQALAIFQKRFGPYPYNELSVAESALVGGAGGAEFSGLVSVASMLYRTMLGGANLQALQGLLGSFAQAGGSPLEFTTAHEVAHQYWYGLVGSDAREHPFVDESLTQWSALYYFETRYGPQRAAAEGDAQVRMNYQLMRSLGQADGAVDRPVDALGSPLAYAGLVYGKGAYFYVALRKACGDAAFFEALHEYGHRYRFQTAPPDALYELLARGDRSAKVYALARHWLTQAHGDSDLGRGKLPDLSAAVGGGAATSNGAGQRRIGSKSLEQLLGRLGGGGADKLLEKLPGMIGALLGEVEQGTQQLDKLGASKPAPQPMK